MPIASSAHFCTASNRPGCPISGLAARIEAVPDSCFDGIQPAQGVFTGFSSRWDASPERPGKLFGVDDQTRGLCVAGNVMTLPKRPADTNKRVVNPKAARFSAPITGGISEEMLSGCLTLSHSGSTSPDGLLDLDSRGMGVQVNERSAAADLDLQTMAFRSVIELVRDRAGYSAGIGLSVDCVSASTGELDLDCT
jgi:hypothetical protein